MENLFTLPHPLPSKGGELKSPLPWWERARERGLRRDCGKVASL